MNDHLRRLGFGIHPKKCKKYGIHGSIPFTTQKAYSFSMHTNDLNDACSAPHLPKSPLYHERPWHIEYVDWILWLQHFVSK